MGGLMDEWMGGWIGGGKIHFKDCLQQSKSPKKGQMVKNNFNLCFILLRRMNEKQTERRYVKSELDLSTIKNEKFFFTV